MKPGRRRKEEETLCWICQNAVPNRAGRGCNWSKQLKPVPGWRTRELGAEAADGYFVEECPLFLPEK